MGSFKVIACLDPNNERHFIVPRHVLRISPIFKGYLDEPDTTPPGLQRNGSGTITLNNDGDVVHAVLEHLKQVHGDENLTIEPSIRGAIFYVRLYKLALSLGLDKLCAMALRTLTSQTRKVDEFITVALEASQWGLINEENFRLWFTRYVHQRQDDLLEIFTDENDALKMCRILITALALVKDDQTRRDSCTLPNGSPVTPNSMPYKREEDVRAKFTKTTPSQNAPNQQETQRSSAKKRRFNATVEDASASE